VPETPYEYGLPYIDPHDPNIKGDKISKTGSGDMVPGSVINDYIQRVGEIGEDRISRLEDRISKLENYIKFNYFMVTGTKVDKVPVFVEPLCKNESSST